ncbi:hypothetical protein DFP73DRAFT_552611 [Morchella snyderi]|nr:hypothetical protein DFP73DRAFT_552611 [Morchella snyderi]
MAQPILRPSRPDWDKPNMPTPAEWEKVKEIFARYYLNIDNSYGKLTLNEIRKIMAENHGFNANETQYKNKIKKWQLRRNLDKDVVKNMARIQDERAAQGVGKKTAFKLHGAPVSEHRLRRARKHLELTQPIAADLESSATPPTITYSTPRSPSSQINVGMENVSIEIATATNGQHYDSNSVDIARLDEEIGSEIRFIDSESLYSTSKPIEMDINCINSQTQLFSVVVHTPYGSCKRLSRLERIEFGWPSSSGAGHPMRYEVINLSHKPTQERNIDLQAISFTPCLPGSWNKCMSKLFHYLCRGDIQGLSQARGRVHATFKHNRSFLPYSLGDYEFGLALLEDGQSNLPVPVHAVLEIELPEYPSQTLSILQPIRPPSPGSDPFHPGKDFLKNNKKQQSMRGSVWMSSAWGGESIIGSWIKNDVIMSGISPFGSDSRSVCSRSVCSRSVCSRKDLEKRNEDRFGPIDPLNIPNTLADEHGFRHMGRHFTGYQLLGNLNSLVKL